MTKANINNVKIGDKAYIEVEIIDVDKAHNYSIKTSMFNFTEQGLSNRDNHNAFQLYIKEEIPTLGEGIEMMVSNSNRGWVVKRVVAKVDNGYLYTVNEHNGFYYLAKFAKPTELTIKEQLANALKEIEEIKKQLNK